MSTWRSNIFTLPTTDFNRISRSGSAEELTGNGPVYEYVLQEPVEIQEGDILGIEFIQMGAEELQFVFQDLGVGNAPDSYPRTVAARSIDTRFVLTRNRRYLPLITAVIGENAHVASNRQSGNAQSNLQQVLQMSVQRQWSSPPPPLHPHPHSHNHKPHFH